MRMDKASDYLYYRDIRVCVRGRRPSYQAAEQREETERASP
jgi:hypothetical protein